MADRQADHEFGQMPVFNWDGLELYHIEHIVRFIAKKTGLTSWGNRTTTSPLADMVLEHSLDLNAIVKVRL